MTTPGARPAITRAAASDDCRRTRRDGWDRTATTAADINRISTAVDVDLRRARADRAVQLRQAADVSVVDAIVGQAAESATKPAVVLPSAVDDMTRLAGTLAGDVRVIGI